MRRPRAGASGLLAGVPGDDPEPESGGRLEPVPVEPAVGSAWDGDEPFGHRAGRGHDAEQPLDLRWVADDLRPGQHVVASQPDAHRLAADEVELPGPPARGQHSIYVAGIADLLPFRLL